MIEQFEFTKHSGLLETWLKPRGLTMISEEQLPAFGLVIPTAAMAFVYMADGGLALIDRLVTNPMSSPGEKETASVHVFEGLIAHARLNGAKQIIAFSQRPSISSWLSLAGLTKHGSDGAFFYLAAGE